MLFNSYEFILLFLPVTLAGFFLLGRVRMAYGAGWLALASLAFYARWNAAYVLLLCASIAVNYGFGLALAARPRERRGRLLAVAVAANLALLGYFKYANFFAAEVGALLGAPLGLGDIVLPLGISFYTFTQIAFLVDTARGEAREPNFVHYVLFVTYFPHQIAGPILHHGEMMPQFAQPAIYRPRHADVAIGLSLFVMGLFKKVVLADGIAVYAGPVFAQAAAGQPPGIVEAWCGALAYTFQIYFDFSGYSDMAVGISRLFNIRLPVNFDSPYRAANITEFWRRWHMTLSRFLRDYLYIPLGGNRRGPERRTANLMAVMLLGGLWHGAGWTFLIWGGLHGLYLVVNHAWRATPLRALTAAGPGRWLAWALTFAAVVVAWVFFRAPTAEAAFAVLRGMAGLNGTARPTWLLNPPLALADLTELVPLNPDEGEAAGPNPWGQVLLLPAYLVAGLALPNSMQLVGRFLPDYRETGMLSPPAGGALAWRPGMAWSVALGVAFAWVVGSLSQVSEFLYFQF